MPERDRQLIYRSGPCEIDLARRELRSHGTAVPLGARAFEVIEALARAGGALVTKEGLMDAIWPGAVVTENTLHVHVSAVRKALGAHRALLKTETGRGYRLLGDWVVRQNDAAATPVDVGAQHAAAAAPSNLPVQVSHLVGRAGAVQQLQDLLSAYRAVTLTGPGGIGKTSLALDVARALVAGFEGGGWLVELGTSSSGELVSTAVSAVLGLRISGDAISAEAVARAIGDRHLLLVLDNCEHVIDAAARFVETVLRLCRRATVLATSREALLIEGEYVYRVQPLDVPLSDQEEPGNLLRHSAIELFVARMRAQDLSLEPDSARLSAVAAICRHLDGIPLAIEFAAARAAVLGLTEVAAHLDDRFQLLTAGRRTALPRHQTLRAALDWSYELLSADEQHLLQRLAIFPAGFGLEAAEAVAGIDGGTTAIAEGIGSLVTKSLLNRDTSAPAGRWRLLETMRTYALEKLAGSGEFETVARRHAEYYRDVFERAETELETRPRAEWLDDYGRKIDNLRAALDWTSSPGGDASIGVALTAAAAPLWMELSLMEECRSRVERALAHVDTESIETTRPRMQLYGALSLSLMYTKGAPHETVEAAWTTTLRLAERLGDADYQLRAIWGLFAGSINSGRFVAALALAKRFRDLAAQTADAADALIGERIVGVALHFLGDQRGAREHTERMLRHYVPPIHSMHLIRFQIDQLVVARRVLATILWLQGYPDQAVRTIESAVADALATNHALTLCNTLAQAACPLAFLTRDLAAAERFIAMLLEHSARHALDVWNAYGRCFQGMLLIEGSEFDGGLTLMCNAAGDLRRTGFTQYDTPYLGALAEALGRTGRIVEGLAAIDEGLARSERTEERWCFAELLRIKGELVARHGGPEATAKAEEHFLLSLDWARRQGALSWELRAATSLARLLHDQGQPADDALALLQPVYERFTEGFDTADLRAARSLLGTLDRAYRSSSAPG